jgi:hypothetical protein
MLSRYLQDAVAPIYHLAGPPEMVKTIKTAGVKNGDIREEEFSGY